MVRLKERPPERKPVTGIKPSEIKEALSASNVVGCQIINVGSSFVVSFNASFPNLPAASKMYNGINQVYSDTDFDNTKPPKKRLGFDT